MDPTDPSPQESALLERLAIPPQPEALRRIAQEARREEVDLSRVAEWIAADTSLAGGLLWVVNSPLFRRRREISAIREAVLLLGLERTRAVVRTVALRNALSHLPEMGGFWKTGVRVGETCARAVQSLRRPDLVDDAYLLGIFHLVGVPALRGVFGEAYDPMLREAAVHGWSGVLQAEQASFGVHHARIAALVTRQWHVPAAVSTAIEGQYRVAHLETLDHADAPDLVVALKLALRALAAEDNTRLTYTEWEQLAEPLTDYLGLADASALEAQVDGIAMD
ncbi:HD-like signal output (HDOD) domain, no enzymatic activity [Ectothiorhodospira mobilis]|uniref:HD-like signal output (HDOD) domain, no enzymatic activity n=1 Tax=Ectothiorhodospira mobilis TaxID=195064 RepID=A0A1I4QK99_ECTMO|nr:HDOD domain-containing protein [Ectothiorhodospira mobilis]SFM40100.1 HD-like signal output (HDOD) domain, no enzymatic activity [Ectothiorhodospira mobilis]